VAWRGVLCLSGVHAESALERVRGSRSGAREHESVGGAACDICQKTAGCVRARGVEKVLLTATARPGTFACSTAPVLEAARVSVLYPAPAAFCFRHPLRMLVRCSVIAEDVYVCTRKGHARKGV
jgi:hypothetical protein